MFLSVEVVGRSPNSSLLHTWVSRKSDLASLVKYLHSGILSLQPEKVTAGGQRQLHAALQLEKVTSPSPLRTVDESRC